MQHARCSVISMTICLIQLVIRPTRPASLIPDQPDYVGNDNEVYCQTTDGYLVKPPFPIVWITVPIFKKMKSNGDYSCKLNEAKVKQFLNHFKVKYKEFEKKHKTGPRSLKLWLSHHDIKVGYPPYNFHQLMEEKRKAEAKTYDGNSCKKHCEEVEGWIVEYRLGKGKGKGKDHGNHHNDIKTHGEGTDHGDHSTDIKTHGKGKDHGNHHTNIKTHGEGMDHGNHSTEIKTHDNGTDHSNHSTEIKTHDKGKDHGNIHTDIKPLQALRRIHITRSRVDTDKKCHCDLNHIEVREFLAKQEKELLNNNFARLWGESHSRARQFLRENGIDIGYAPRKSLAEWFKEPL